MSGPGAWRILSPETGGHRWQRVPPTEKRGRVHTSTVTVAVLALSATPPALVRDEDLEYSTTVGTGPGGQHRNKTQSAVQLRHRPSGMLIRCEVHRSQHRNRLLARQWLVDRLAAQGVATAHAARNADRREGIGSGQRGDKIRTVRCQDGVVLDHRTGTRWPLRRYLAGELPPPPATA